MTANMSFSGTWGDTITLDASGSKKSRAYLQALKQIEAYSYVHPLPVGWDATAYQKYLMGQKSQVFNAGGGMSFDLVEGHQTKPVKGFSEMKEEELEVWRAKIKAMREPKAYDR